MSQVQNRAQTLETDQKVIQAVGQYLGSIVSMMFLGQAYTPGDLKAVFQAEIDGLIAVEAKRAAYRAQVLLTKASSAKARELRKALRSYILSTYGATAAEVLTAFGISIPTQRAPKTVATKAEALQKAKATRQARHTMGKKQKAQITVPAVTLPTPKA
jgi:hypothetical protein